MNCIKANARKRKEQDVDLVLKNLKVKLLGQPLEEVLLTPAKRYKHHKTNEDRSILKDGVQFRKYYGKTGSVKYNQSLVPEQLVDEVFRSSHGELRKHAGITKTVNEYPKKLFLPNMAQIISEWVISCKQGIRES